MNITWRNEKRKIKDLVPYSANPRQITQQQAMDLKASLERFGVVAPIIVNTNNTIIGGHQRTKILEALINADPDYLVDVRIPDREMTDDEVRELNIRLNKNVAEWDFDVLANNFNMDELFNWGFDKSELDMDLWFTDPQEDPEVHISQAAELREALGVETGQLWQLGNHRLICGDCTDPKVIERLMQGEKAACMWTDPPYGVNYVGKTKDQLTIENDSSDNLQMLLTLSFKTADEILRDGSPIYIAHPAGKLQMVFDEAFVDAGWKFHETLVWVKDSMVLGHSDYHYKHEPILYGWKGKNRKWYGGRNQVSVLEVDRPKRSTDHPTMKPPELIEACLKNSTEVGDLVFEPFAGSGSTIIACEHLGRHCRAVEISPEYCAVTINRWAEMTSQEPVLIG